MLPVAPQLDLDRGALRFGQEFGSGTWVNTAPQQSLLLRNGGQQDLVISSAALSGADATAFSLSALDGGATLTSGEQRFVRVIFSPTQAGLYSASLTMSSNDPTAPVTMVRLQGVGLASTGGQGLNPECRANDCVSPPELNGGGGPHSTWLAYTEDGANLSYVDDADGDGDADDRDNCPYVSNGDQLDGDGDGVGDSCDNCAAASNVTQLDLDADGQGNACDTDEDGDSIINGLDNCPWIPNRDQLDTNNNLAGNVCDNDDDGDGILDTLDVCPFLPNPGNMPVNDPRCNADADGDNISDSFDNCLAQVNAPQLDTDLDGLGDACDLDSDNDGVLDVADNCAFVANRDQRDEDGDVLGDACDARYCLVIDPSNRQDCLDPLGPFRVHGGGAVSVRVGEPIRLPLFANRNGAAIRYAWTITSRPAGSTAAVVNPQGLAGLSRHWEYAYVDGLVPSFQPDRAGDYTLQLQGTLGAPDRAFPANAASTSELRLTVSP